MIRSTEQCQRLWQPEIELVDNKQLQKLLNENSPLVLDCTGEYRENFIAKSIIVGPEGGWSEEEIEKFKNLNLGICKISELVLPAWIAGYTYLT
ncbi:RNA methyltransferase [Candidatus Gracilibacteria bacterium]|nr:RNA methyltransferase [Candidatus Gracilibacteria bacterium]